MSIKGRLKDIGLVDILEILHAEKKTVGVHVGSEKGYGKIYMKDGEVVHASYRESSGTEAFYDVLSWKEGDFDVEPGEAAPDETIKQGFDNLVTEGMRKREEEKDKDRAKYAEDEESANLIKRLLEMGILEKAGPS